MKLSNEELIVKYKETKDEYVLDELYENVKKISYASAYHQIRKGNLKYLGRIGINTFDDLVSELKIEFMICVNRFDSECNVKFSTFYTNYVNLRVINLIKSCFYKKNALDDSKVISISYRDGEKDHDIQYSSIMEERLKNENNGVIENYEIKVFVEHIFSSKLLTNNQRKCLKLLINGYTQSDISKMLNMTSNCVASTLYAARQNIKKYNERVQYY